MLLLTVAILPLVAFVPAFAEVETIQTDRQLYSVDMSIYFTGTVDSADSGKLVNLMVFDPSGKLVLMTGKFAEQNGTFEMVANTNDPSQFGAKGTYSATAFVTSQSSGKTVGFDFSPDGSPVSHLAAGNPTMQEGGNPAPSAPPMHFQSVISENLTAQDLTNMSGSKTASHLGGNPASLGFSDVIYPAMAACGAAIVGFIAYMRSKSKKNARPHAVPRQETPVEGEDLAMTILKSRLARGEITLDEFKATKDALAEP